MESFVSLRIVSLFGLFFMLFVAWLFSENKRRMDRRIILTGLALQFLVGLLLLKTGFGRTVFWGANHFFSKIIQFSNEGASFLFGDELVSKTVAFNILPTIIFVSTLSAVLFHIGIIQRLIQGIAWIMVRVMNISGVESLVSAANIYIGMTESPLFVKPYLATATRSEIMVMATAGMATIAGGVMAAFINMGASAGHLLTASLMSAPAAIVIAKIMVPETETSPTKGWVKIHPPQNACNILDAACRGASDGLGLALNVGTMLIAAIALIALLNWTLVLIPEINGEPLTLQRVFGWLFAPFAFLMGVSSQDVFQIGRLLGEKTVINEFIAYVDLTALYKERLITERSFVVAQYALCGFANFGSIAITIGGIGQLVPERREVFAKLAFRAMIGGTLAAFCTACVAGVLL